MIAFSAAAAGIIAAVLAIVLAPLVRSPKVPRRPSHAALNAQVYRDQLALEGESRDGVLQRALDEAGAEEAPLVRAPARGTALALAFLLPSLALALYVAIGSPAALAPDTAASLEAHLKRMPHDARAWIILARGKLDAGQFEDAAHAYERALEASQKVARDPQVWCELADAVGMAQGRSLKGRPRELVEHALALDPNHPRALEMAGSAHYEAGNYRDALAYWEPLLAQLPERTPEYQELSAAIERTRMKKRLNGE